MRRRLKTQYLSAYSVIYINRISNIFAESFKDDDFTATVAHSEEEACKLIEAGFEYVCDFAQNKIFRKRK
jgi:hypothetical protein